MMAARGSVGHLHGLARWPIAWDQREKERKRKSAIAGKLRDAMLNDPRRGMSNYQS